jgi:prephenate dehydrogenase
VSEPKVLIIGAGLLGTSLGLALSRQGVVPAIEDLSKANQRLAIDYGAGVRPFEEPDLVFVCVPPDITAQAVVDQLKKYPRAIVTDVASVKSFILEEVASQVDSASLARYVGSHPMAGREKGGPGSARADLFFARPWVITPRVDNDSLAVSLIRDAANRIGALPIELSVEKHDSAVALVSHLPQLISSLLAARLVSGSEEQLNLAGQGLRDTARIASSDPDLWIQIISQNAPQILPLLVGLQSDLHQLVASISNLDEVGALAKVHTILDAGNRGVSKIPGKHGGKFLEYQLVTVVIDDSPGALAGLLMFIGEIGVNIEDLKLEHSPGAAIGLVELQVMPESAGRLVEKLSENGWRLV